LEKGKKEKGLDIDFFHSHPSFSDRPGHGEKKLDKQLEGGRKGGRRGKKKKKSFGGILPFSSSFILTYHSSFKRGWQGRKKYFSTR